MDPEVAAKLIEGHKDTLSEKVQAEQKFYESLSCPRCGGSVAREMDIVVDEEERVSTRYMARCRECKCLFNPDLGLIVEMGNLANLEPAIPIIHGRED